MIFTRIVRGAVRTGVLINSKISHYGRPAMAATTHLITRLRRPAGLSLLAAYTATIPLHALQGSVALADESEPPSMIAVQRLTSEALTAVSMHGVDTVTLHTMQVGKSRDTLRQEEELRRLQEEAATRAAAERSRQEAIRREQARKEAELAAAQARQREQAAAAVVVQAIVPSGSIQEIAQQMVTARFGANQFAAFAELVRRESGWNTTSRNTSSGAYGIGQALPGSKMAPYGADWATNPVTQLKWMLDYIAYRYGNPVNALAFHNAHHWY